MTRWYEAAQAELGVAEVPGAGNNPRIVAYMEAAGFHQQPDATPWCAGFANWCLAQAGVEGTGSLSARSFLRWGVPLSMPREGCIVVLTRGTDPAAGHVGFYAGQANGRVLVLGGNQGNKVSIAAFRAEDVLSYRWPEEAALPTPDTGEHFEAHDRLREQSWTYNIKGWLTKLAGGGSLIGAGSLPHWHPKPIDIALLLLGAALAAIVMLEVMRYRQRAKALGGQK